MTDSPQRLNSIVTLWSVVHRAHAEGGTRTNVERRRAQDQLLDRYGGAVRRYLGGALRDDDAADEVFQEFALRFVRGDFHKADPGRGRFRSFLKTIVYHMICDYQNRKKRDGRAVELREEILEPASLESPPASVEAEFAQSWREEVLARAWRALQQREVETGSPFFTALRLRAENPDWKSPELASELSKQVGSEITAESARQTVHRARKYFADTLLDEISQSLADPSDDSLREELGDLELLEYCRPALERRG